jgi:hypothetical protein
LKPEREDLFPLLEPPPGGLARLRSLLDQEEMGRRRMPLIALGMASAAAAVLVAFVLLSNRGTGEPWRDSEDPTLVRLGLTAPPSEPVEIPLRDRSSMAAMRVAVDDPNVVFYLVASAQ